MAVLINSDVIATGPTPGMVKRAWNAIAKICWEACGHHWGKAFRPLHFQSIAHRRYKIKPRDPDYNQQKYKLFGHRRPLVFTGESEESTENYRVIPTSKGCRVTMRAPALNYSRRGEDLTQINEQEAKSLTKIFDKQMAQQLLKLKTKKEKIR